jgi:phosphoglycerate-specific signal transduction histidine kinase
MWLLAWALVKVINYRSRLHDSETEQMVAREEVVVKKTQLKTMHEVVRGLQHEINNPLSIITLYLPRAKKQAAGDEQQMKTLDEIDKSAQRISKALLDFSKAQLYEVDSVNVVGDIARPPK